MSIRMARRILLRSSGGTFLLDLEILLILRLSFELCAKILHGEIQLGGSDYEAAAFRFLIRQFFEFQVV